MTRPLPLAIALVGAMLLVHPDAVARDRDSSPPARMLADVGSTIFVDYFSHLTPAHFVELDGVLYFIGSDGVHGRELWRSDGTAEGTWQVADVCPGACHGILDPWMTVAGDAIYFAGRTLEHGVELWRSDGTAEGTWMVREIQPGVSDVWPRLFLAAGSSIYFAAGEEGTGSELWVSDGTAEGTRKVKGFPGASHYSVAPVAQIPGGDVLFQAPGGLWRTDGSEEGTWLVKELVMLLFSPFSPRRHTTLGERVVFSAQGEGSSSAPWITDGTPEGTFMLHDPGPAGPGADPLHFVATEGRVYFTARTPDFEREHWRSDGTAAGTQVVWSPEPPRNLAELTLAGGKLFVGTNSWSAGSTLYAMDLATESVQLVKELPELDGLAWFLTRWTAMGDLLLFPGGDEATGVEPWRSDGTERGTYPLGDLYPGPVSSLLTSSLRHPAATVEDGALFFALEARQPEFHWTLFQTDGTPEGTAPLITPDLQTSAARSPAYGHPAPLLSPRLMPMMATRGGLFFVPLRLPAGLELWYSDGTEAGTRRVREIVNEEGFSRLDIATEQDLTWTGRRLFFRAYADGAEEVWISDGSEEGTVPLAEAVGGSFGEAEGPFFAFQGRAYFTAEGTIWRSDGTPGGTETLPLTGIADSEGLAHRAVSGNTLFLSAGEEQTGRELWRIDGGSGAPQLVADLVPGPGSSSPAALSAPLTASLVDSIVYFSADTPDAGRELWRSDGTAAGTWRVADVRPGPESGMRPTYPTETHNDGTAIVALRHDLVFFIADDGVSGEELWVSNGTEEGTRLLADLCPGECSSRPRWLTAAGSQRLFFVATTPQHGRELWVTDGTADGTYVLDIVPGEASAVPGHLLWASGRLYFSAWHPETGVELWSSDGTPEGTDLYQDINPGPGSSTPLWPTRSGQRIYFVANDGVHGFEPWILDLDESPGRDLARRGAAVATP
jgi:large repetitive protein